MKKIIIFAEWIRLKYQIIIIIAVILGLILGVWTTAPGLLLQRYSQILTFLMIFFISLTITPKQFSAIKNQPLAVLNGLLLNFAFMPIICWVLAKIFVTNADLAVGIILVGVVPCAGMAAVWTALLKADVPLSMAINALTMVLAPFLIPPLMIFLSGSTIALDPWKMFQQLAVILLIPLLLGIFIRWWVEKHWDVKQFLPLLPASSALIAVLLMFAICNVNTPLILQNWEQTPPLIAALILVFPLGFLVPFWIASKTKWQTRIAITFSSGMKNLPIAVGLAFASFPKISGLPVALAMIMQMITASIFYRYLYGQKK
jgi:predicted Na+-dependent transporter